MTQDVDVALFEASTLLEFLNNLLDIRRHVRALRTRLAEAAGCQASYLSQVLAGTATFSVEQLRGIARYLELQPVAWEYLRELGILARAGTVDVREDCKQRLLRLRAEAANGAAPLPAQLTPDAVEVILRQLEMRKLIKRHADGSVETT
jgi:hypothetical protein